MQIHPNERPRPPKADHAMAEEETLIFVRTHPNGIWSDWQPHFKEVVEIMCGRRADDKVQAQPTEIIEVRVTKRVFVTARVVVDVDPRHADGRSSE